jgi:hypothetical protein
MLVKIFFGLLKGRFIILHIDIPLHYMLDLVIACICVHNMSNVNYDAIYINRTLNTQKEAQAKTNSTFDNIKGVDMFKVIREKNK